jgi:hypothetical protein
LQSLAIEAAEACAEWLHRRIREDWGFPDPPEMTMAQRYTSRYRGKRYSFGYPACPDLEDPAGIWKLLKPEEIGVELTEGFMMDPEASVSALAFIHPDCSCLSVGEELLSSPQVIPNKQVSRVFSHLPGSGAPKRDKVLPHGGSGAGHSVDGANPSSSKLLL